MVDDLFFLRFNFFEFWRPLFFDCTLNSDLDPLLLETNKNVILRVQILQFVCERLFPSILSMKQSQVSSYIFSSPMATVGALVGLAPKQSSKPPFQIEI